MAAAKKKAAVSAISEDELAQRVAILRRFRELLVKQRERFQRYLTTLEKQQSAIETGKVGELADYIELEEQIVADIFSIQKVIDPLEDMYQSAVPVSSGDDIPALKSSLEELKGQVVARAVHNRELLSSRMNDIRSEIIELRNNPFANAARTAFQHTGTASMIDIEG